MKGVCVGRRWHSGPPFVQTTENSGKIPSEILATFNRLICCPRAEIRISFWSQFWQVETSTEWIKKLLERSKHFMRTCYNQRQFFVHEMRVRFRDLGKKFCTSKLNDSICLWSLSFRDRMWCGSNAANRITGSQFYHQIFRSSLLPDPRSKLRGFGSHGTKFRLLISQIRHPFWKCG